MRRLLNTGFAAAGLLLAACATTDQDTTSEEFRQAIAASVADDEVRVESLWVIPPVETEPVEIAWSLNGIEQTRETVEAEPGEEYGDDLAFKPHSGETIVEAAMMSASGAVERQIFRVYGQQFIAEPPAIDGKFTGDWNDPPVVYIDAPMQQISPDERKLSKDEFAAIARAVWHGDTLYLGLEVTDPTPPGDDQATVSLSIGTDTGALHELNPDSESPLLEQAATRTDEGYIFEAAIPAPGGYQPEPGDFARFNLVIQAGPNELMWQEAPAANHMISPRGIAALLPDPSTISSPGRNQLHGGETERPISETATKDSAYLTPLPVENKEGATYLPGGLAFEFPAEGTWEITKAYGYENDSWTHQTIGNQSSANDFFALDINMPIGTPLLAPAPGRLIQSNLRGDSYGNYVVIDHGEGIQSIYAHLNELVYDVDKGQPPVYVETGDVIGYSGTSGTSYPHLHFAIHKDARASHSGANVGGLAVVPEPLSGYYGLRRGHMIDSGNVAKDPGE